MLSVFAREAAFVEAEDDKVKSNQIFLDGFICKPPVYRKTPLGAGDRRYAGGRKPSLRKIGLYSLYFLGPECPFRLQFLRWEAGTDVGPDSEP